MKSKIPFSIWGIIAWLTVVVYIIFGSVRDASIGSDTETYINYFYDITSAYGTSRQLEPGFHAVAYLVSTFFSHEIFLALLLALTCFYVFGGMVNGLGNRAALFIFIWLSYPLFFSISLNILRQGLAYGILYSFLLIREQSKIKSLIVVILAASFHYIALLIGMLMMLSKRVQFIQALVFWGLCLLLGYIGIANFFEMILNYLPSEFQYYLHYLDESTAEYRTGFRADFLFFSVIGVLVLCVVYYLRVDLRYRTVMGSLDFKRLGVVFLLLNGFALLFIQLPFSDRYFAWSWYLYPVIAYFCLAEMTKRAWLYLIFPFAMVSWLSIYFSLAGIKFFEDFRNYMTSTI